MRNDRPKAMLDTNAINRIADGQLELSALSSFDLVLTHVQIHETGATRQIQRRTELLDACGRIPSDKVPTKTSVWGISRWGEGSWGTDEYYEKILSIVTDLDAKSGKRLGQKHRIKDALIGATALMSDCTLISGDRNLLQAVRECGGQVINVDEDDLTKLTERTMQQTPGRL